MLIIFIVPQLLVYISTLHLYTGCNLKFKMFTSLSLRVLLVIVALHGAAPTFIDHHRPDTGEPGGVIVHLMDWRYDDIAYECETILSKRGFAGVQISPVTEYLIPQSERWLWKAFGSRPWYDRHQVASYKIITPSGNENDFKNMVERCNKVGIKVYVDVVLNHMTVGYDNDKIAYGGTRLDPKNLEYPAVPYTRADFHDPSCYATEVDPKRLRNCEFRGLHDLNQTNPCVREKQRRLLNKLISFGVAGFRVGHTKFMWPEDLKKLFGHLDYLNCDHGFACDTSPFIYQDYFGIDEYSPVKPNEYLETGLVTEYNYAAQVSKIFHHNEKPTNFANIKESWKLMDSDKSVVFVDTYESQHEGSTKSLITTSERKLYKLAVVLMLASPYGQPLITSNFVNSKYRRPPYTVDKNGRDLPTNQQDKCATGWVCEHRYSYIQNMLTFRKIAEGQPVTNWWQGERYQFAFSRGNKGFVLFNNDGKPILNKEFQTGLPKGTYCDIISGNFDAKTGCTATEVKVDANGKAIISLKSSDHWEGVLVIHAGAKIN